MACMFAMLAGALVGFLRYNFNPARIFLGDSGSLLIGYLLASLTIVATYYQRGVPTALPVLMPAVVLGVPLFDTISVMLIRLKLGKPLMQGDTNHFSHRLLRLGMNVRQAVAFIYLTTLAMGLAAVPLQHLPPRGALTQTSLIVLLFILIYLLERAGRLRGESTAD
jgi:UDP-GlcNAc:undecaprenyl-phosphate GlcNAc-1-phosphate transferase